MIPRLLPLTIAACLLSLLLAHPVAAQEASRRWITDLEGKKTPVEQVYPHSYALLIGVNHYLNVPDRNLHFAVNDVEDLKQVLVAHYGFPEKNVVTLLDEQATKRGIEQALNKLIDTHKITEEDRILIYFSGHGQTMKLPTGGQMGFLVPSDAQIDLNDTTNLAPYLGTCLSMRSVWDSLDACPARHVLLIADACYSGLLATQKGLKGLSPQALDAWKGMRARQILTAGGQGEETEEQSQLGHGAFTYKLLEALKQRATEAGHVFLASDLYGGLLGAVKDLTEGRQTPQLAKYHEEGEFLFITTGKTSDKSGPKPGGKHNQDGGGNAPAAATKINPRDGAEMVLIPAGEFTMGSTSAEIEALLRSNASYLWKWFACEMPQHKVYLDSYYIYKTPVTVKQYLAFCAATGHAKPLEPSWGWREDHPIVNVSWSDANAYCAWLSRETGLQVSLPTAAQWEKAARGTSGRKFPWGNEWDENKLQCSKAAYGDAGSTAPVGSYPSGASPYGLLDMEGNVLQWCSDWYDPNYYKSSPSRNPQGPANGTEHLLRGRNWLDNDPTFFRCTSTMRELAPIIRGRGASGVGFRCVASAN